VKLAFRIAAVLLLLFCAAHTLGGMLSHGSLGAEADAVLAQMKAVHFDFNGSNVSFWGFWFGFGMMLSVFLLFSAVAAWVLGSISPAQWSAVAPIAWALVVAHLFIAGLSWVYFFAAPAVFSGLAAGLMAFGSWKKAQSSAG
jgi:hypothetical protein